MSGKVQLKVSNQRFVNSCLANSDSVKYTLLYAPHNFVYYLSSPSGMFCLYVILTISYLRAQTIETSLLTTDSSRPLFKQIVFFFYIDCMTQYISTVSTFSNIRAFWAKSLREQQSPRYKERFSLSQ